MNKKKFNVVKVDKIVERFERFVKKYKSEKPRKC